MNIIIKLLNIYLSFVYFFMKLFPTKNNVLFMTRQTNEPSLDFSMLINHLKEKDQSVNVVVLCKRMGNRLIDKINYFFYMHKQMFALATSRVCIIDTYVPVVSMLKHKKVLKVLQTWHALGAVKKFGYQSVGTVSGRSEVLSKEAKMHKNYDGILSTSKETTKFYAEAFNYPKNKFYNFGLPRMDYLLKEKDKIKERILTKYPELCDKPIILYAPTFRTTGEDNATKLINSVDLKKYNLVIIEHYSQKLDFDRSLVYTNTGFSPLEMLSVADFLITDYSAVSIEALILNTKTYYYVFDYEDYKKNNGLNMNLYKEMPGYVFADEKQLMKAIGKNKYDFKLLQKFKDKYMTNQDGTSTELIIELILKWYYNK